MKNTLLFCTGISGSGKGYQENELLKTGLFYKLISATTRPIRDGEKNNKDYFFKDENYFNSEKFATKLWVNESVWNPGDPKWIYGVPEFEIINNFGKNFIYDVIEPKYIREMINWFNKYKFNNYYDFKIAYFLPPSNNFDIAESRANMKNDLTVRRKNTCDPIDFLRANLHPNWFIKSSEEETIIPDGFNDFINSLKAQKIK